MQVAVPGSYGSGGEVVVPGAGGVHQRAGLEQPVPVHLVLALADQLVTVQVDLGAPHERLVVQAAVVAPDRHLGGNFVFQACCAKR